MVNDSCFLPNRKNDPLRKTLWEYYCSLERYFLCELSYRVATRVVKEGGASFSSRGTVKIPFKSDDTGALFHEFTHDLFHHSVFHSMYLSCNAIQNEDKENPVYNETWGEGFCDAVRWLMETQHQTHSSWLERFHVDTQTDWRKARAERILNYTGWTLTDFADCWSCLVRNYDKTGDYLNQKIK